MRWTTRQDKFLYEHANLGAKAISKLMYEKFGIKRKPEAIRRHAYRVGISMYRYETCPACGAAVKKLMFSGFCKKCNYEKLTKEQMKRNEEIEKQLTARQTQQELQAEREYAAVRAKTKRLKKKLHQS